MWFFFTSWHIAFQISLHRLKYGHASHFNRIQTELIEHLSTRIIIILSEMCYNGRHHEISAPHYTPLPICTRSECDYNTANELNWRRFRSTLEEKCRSNPLVDNERTLSKWSICVATPNVTSSCLRASRTHRIAMYSRNWSDASLKWFDFVIFYLHWPHYFCAWRKYTERANCRNVWNKAIRELCKRCAHMQ